MLSLSPRHLLHHPSTNQFAIGVLVALDAILAPGAPLLEEEGGIEVLVLFHQLACLCPIEISFRQTNTQLVQFARKNWFYRQIVGKLCIGESFLILLSLLCRDTQNFGNNKKKCRNFEKLCSEIVLFVL